DQAHCPLHDQIAANIERYEQGTLIDQGGMKKIILIQDSLTDRPVAMATLREPDNLIKAERFFQEARLTAALEHPNIIPIYDIGLNENYGPYFTMKLIAGSNLTAIFTKDIKKNIPLQQLMDIFNKICDAVAYAHSKGILHLDLKPENIRIGEYGEVVLSDWGLAKVIGSYDDTEESGLDPLLYNDITLDGIIKGTPGYMAPEQIETTLGSKDERTDVYALGGILYFMLCGKSPVSGTEIQQILDDTLANKICLPSAQLTENLPAGLEAVTMKALSFSRDDRYQSVERLHMEITQWQSGFATNAEEASFLKASFLLLKRHKTIASLLSIIIIILIFSFIQISRNERKAIEALNLYEEEKQQTELLGREASPRMAFLALRAIRAFEFDKALEFINRAVETDPHNNSAWYRKGHIHFIRQQFHQAKQAFKKSSPRTHYSRKIIKLSKKFALLKANDQELLDSDNFIKLLSSFTNMGDIHKLYRYEAQHYTSLVEHNKTFEFMLKHDNRKVSDWHVSYDLIDGHLTIDLSNHKSLTNISSLINMPVNSLNISNTAVWQTSPLHQLPLQILNIKNCNISSIDKLLKIKTIKQIIVGNKQNLLFHNNSPIIKSYK
ncbi:MAG: protein kinase, partial [Lentisphaeraceae bacterium]|nr:protein kinase [Lentisphaeraceae bacterium]